jgi:hypothetical protein
LDLNGQTLTNTNALTLNGMGISTSGALTNSNSTTGVYAGSITLGSVSTIGGTGGAISVTGAISDIANDYGLILVGNKAINLSSSSNLLRIISSTSSIGALTIVNSGDLTIGSIASGGSRYDGINSSGAINIRTTGKLTISKSIETTSTSKSASAPALLLASGSGDAAGTTTNNIELLNSPTFTVGAGGAANFYTGGLTESADIKTYVESKTNNNTAAYNSTLTTQPTTAGYNIIFRGFPPYIYVTIVDGQTSTYGTASGLSFWYSTSESSYGASYLPALLSSITTAQTFTAGASTIDVNIGGITGTIAINTTLSSTLAADTYNLTLSPTLALSGAPGVSFRAGNAKNFVVNPRPITLAATNRTKVYGDALSLGTSAFTKTAGTFANSELATAVTLTSANGYDASTNQAVNSAYANEIGISTATGTGGF